MICVKPQILPKIYDQIKNANTNDVLFISIAAGVTTSL